MHPRRPVKRETLLPEYSATAPTPSNHNVLHYNPNSFASTSITRPTLITNSYRAYSPDPLLSASASPGAHENGHPIKLGTPLPAPPSYSSSIKPMLLWLDGGGTRVIIQTYILETIMHRLAWELKYTSEQPRLLPWDPYFIPPKDCFDWVAGCGCGTIVVLAIASGMIMKDVRDKITEMAGALREGDVSQVLIFLESMVPESKMSYGGHIINDAPALTNVWIPAKEKVQEHPGFTVKVGDPIKQSLVPLVLQEISKEINGTAELLDCSIQFLQDVCPIFDDCSFLLCLGAGDVPGTQQLDSLLSPISPSVKTYPPDPEPPQTWWDWFMGRNVPNARRPPLPRKIPEKRSNIIPLKAYNGPKETYIRLSPPLVRYDPISGVRELPDDWAVQFSEFASMTSRYISKEDVKRKLERLETMLRWKEIPGPAKK
ncbi:hypothetical protein FRC14_004201 [Serendipita sp. 396]|nr:hypothetical protein FRC14_004201 [Serendipita sp. 396]